jgi:hypothetical protein
VHGPTDDLNRQQQCSKIFAGLQGSELASYFLQQLRQNGPWVLTAILPDKPAPDDATPLIITATAHTVAEAQGFVTKHNGTRNLYYSVNPTKSEASKKRPR